MERLQNLEKFTVLTFLMTLVAFSLAGVNPTSASSTEDKPAKTLSRCLNGLDFYDPDISPSNLTAGKHPIVPAQDALGRKGFYVYSEESDSADFYPLPPFSSKPAPYAPMILEQNRDATGYYFELKVGAGPAIPIEYWDPRHPGNGTQTKVEEVYPGFGKLNQSPLKPAELHGSGRDAVSAQSKAALARATQAKLSRLVENYRKQKKEMIEKILRNSNGSTPIMVNEIAGQEKVLAAMEEDLARDKVNPFPNRAGVEELKRKRDALAQQIEGKKRTMANRHSVENYVRDQKALTRLRKLTSDALENCSVAPIQALARQVEHELEKDAFYRAGKSLNALSPISAPADEGTPSSSVAK